MGRGASTLVSRAAPQDSSVVVVAPEAQSIVGIGRERSSLDRDPYLLETSVPGIFACGDVRYSPVKRVEAAVGEGSMAIAFVHEYLKDAEPRPEGT